MRKVTTLSLNNVHSDADWFLKVGQETAEGLEVK